MADDNPYQSPSVPAQEPHLLGLGVGPWYKQKWTRLWIAGVLFPPVAVYLPLAVVLVRKLYGIGSGVWMPFWFFAFTVTAGGLLIEIAVRRSGRTLPVKAGLRIAGFGLMFSLLWLMGRLMMAIVEHLL